MVQPLDAAMRRNGRRGVPGYLPGMASRAMVYYRELYRETLFGQPQISKTGAIRMVSIATLGPEGSHAWQAARQFDAEADIRLHPRLADVFKAFAQQEAEFAIVPVYNTREGEIKEYSGIMDTMASGYWVDNIVLPIHLSLGALTAATDLALLIGRSQTLRQCEEYIAANFPNASLLAVKDLDRAIAELIAGNAIDRGVIEAEETLKTKGLAVREREIAPYNRTRFAVLGRTIPPPTGYDATVIVTTPLKDRVGMLYDILGEFTRRGINLLDMHSETDVKTQKLRFYIEMEGHIEDAAVSEALARIEQQVIQEPGCIRVLGSFPRVDMRIKRIRNFGFIGSGDMSRWFAGKLESEGYETLLCGRTSSLRPEEMIPQVDVVVICVPISATPETITQYGPLLREDQGLILLAGEAENALQHALAHTRPEVEVMLVHNLWGPKAATMKDKNVSLVRTQRSGVLCSEFEAFMYKHGANITVDAPKQHDLMMGISQKLPTGISVALAMTLRQNGIDTGSIDSHSTLTSLYGILSMARVHAQNSRTYAEIMASPGDGRKIIRNFAENLQTILAMADQGAIQELCDLIETNRAYLTEEFLRDRMRQSLAVDDTLGRVMRT